MAEITRDGVIQKTTAEYIQELNEAWLNIFGSNLNLGPDTPQGQLTNLQGLIAGKFEQALVDVSRSLDISQAQGQQLEDLTSILAIYRDGAENSSCEASLTGTPLIIIPAGSQAKTTNGDIFILQSSVQLNSGGTGTGTFVAVEVGPIAIDIDTLTEIANPVPGWDTVNNDEYGIVGRDVETDAQFKRRYFNQLARAASGSLESIISAIEELSGIEQVVGHENQTNNIIVERGVRVPPHGFVIAVDGTGYDEIAAEIRRKKSFGSCSLQYVECTIVTDGACELTAGMEVTLLAADNDGEVDCVFRLIENITIADEAGDTVTGMFVAMSDGEHGFLADTDFEIGSTFPEEVTSISNNDDERFVHRNVDATNSTGRVLQTVPINFKAAEYIELAAIVDLATGSTYPTNGDDLVKEAIVAFWNGETSDFAGYRMGDTIYASQLYTPINSIINNTKSQIISVKIGPKGGDIDDDFYEMNLDQRGIISTGDITIS